MTILAKKDGHLGRQKRLRSEDELVPPFDLDLEISKEEEEQGDIEDSANGTPAWNRYACPSCKEEVRNWASCIRHMQPCCPDIFLNPKDLQERCRVPTNAAKTDQQALLTNSDNREGSKRRAVTDTRARGPAKRLRTLAANDHTTAKPPPEEDTGGQLAVEDNITPSDISIHVPGVRGLPPGLPPVLYDFVKDHPPAIHTLKKPATEATRRSSRRAMG
jgi:hypothetical protein